VQLAIGMITAKRQSPTVVDSMKSVKSAFNSQHQPVLFAEPETFSNITESPSGCILVNRPHTISADRMPSSPSGVFYNFGNWIQSARDLLALHRECDTFLMCEDDIKLTPDLTEFIADRLWPSPHCGVISLYCPILQHFTHKRGLIRTDVRYTDILNTHHNLVGALCLLFPRRALQELVDNQESIDEWRGSHTQRRAKDVPKWERKAVDTWIGRTLVQMGYEIWNFNPGLVSHTGVVSSLGNRHHRSRTSKWTGVKPQLHDISRERHVDVCPSSK
jgi:hypothetical protein